MYRFSKSFQAALPNVGRYQNCLIRRDLHQMETKGLELPQDFPDKTIVSDLGGAESGAPPAPTAISDPDLAIVVTAWPDLPEAIRAGIVTMVRTVNDGPTA